MFQNPVLIRDRIHIAQRATCWLSPKLSSTYVGVPSWSFYARNNRINNWALSWVRDNSSLEPIFFFASSPKWASRFALWTWFLLIVMKPNWWADLLRHLKYPMSMVFGSYLGLVFLSIKDLKMKTSNEQFLLDALRFWCCWRCLYKGCNNF